MKNILGLVGLTVLLVGCNGMISVFHDGPQIKGSGKVKTENRKVGSFSKIETRGSADCKVTVGKSTSVSVSADDNILPLVKTYIEKDTLIIETKGSFSTHNPLKVTITTPKLNSFAVEGSGDSTITGVNAESFAVAISGSGNIDASGRADTLTASIDGSGDMNLYNMKSKDATASISGSGNIELFAIGNLTAQISGSGDITYAGHPKNVTKAVSGSGEISAR